MKRFERSNGLDTALYKNYLYFFFLNVDFIHVYFYEATGSMQYHPCTDWARGTVSLFAMAEGDHAMHIRTFRTQTNNQFDHCHF